MVSFCSSWQYMDTFLLLRAQCYIVLNSSVNGLMGFLQGYKLSQLAYRGHSAGCASVSENIINPSTCRRPLTGFIDWERVSDWLTQSHCNCYSIEVRESLMHLWSWKYWIPCSPRLWEGCGLQCANGMWAVIKIYPKAVGGMLEHTCTRNIYHLFISYLYIYYDISFHNNAFNLFYRPHWSQWNSGIILRSPT